MRPHRIHAPASLAAALAAAALLLLGSPVAAAQSASTPFIKPVVVAADVCSADENQGEVATNFISRCRMASIRQVFPGQHYGDTLGYLKGCGEKSCRTAWKLLNDNRFKK
ncbi:hypothetical protein [Streptomyces sp. NPDC051561]|uniref:hypothetical protein n=1 Tax=Streptomyces sp. NPDC051561 TaxID=3365658 RepID=UPI0037B213CB